MQVYQLKMAPYHLINFLIISFFTNFGDDIFTGSGEAVANYYCGHLFMQQARLFYLIILSRRPRLIFDFASLKQ